MRTSEATDKLFAAIAAAQAEMPDVGKHAKNPHFKSSYARLEDVLHAIRPTLAKHKLCILIETGSEVDERGLVLSTARVACGEQWLEVDCWMKPRALDCQQLGGVSTYARRYILGMVFNIACAEPDDDGNGTSVQTPQKEPSEPRKAAPPPAYAVALTDAVKADITALKWTRKQCNEAWSKCEQDAGTFRRYVADQARQKDEIPYTEKEDK